MRCCRPADRAAPTGSEISRAVVTTRPRGLIDAVLADDRIEAVSAAPDDLVSRVEHQVTAWADQLVGSDGGTTSCLTCPCVLCT